MSEQPVFKEETLSAALEQINKLRSVGGIDIPQNYSVANALRTAGFILNETKKIDKAYTTIAKHCSRASIIESLLKMVTYGLNPAKNQCAFVPRGTECTLMVEYQGKTALAKRYGKIKDIVAREIYKGDEYVTIVGENGHKQLKEHIQPIENMDNEIIGAYCVLTLEDGTTSLTELTRKKIETAWSQGNKGRVHDTFTDEMCKKTVINRACKPYINSSDDESILPELPPVTEKKVISIEANEKTPIQESVGRKSLSERKEQEQSFENAKKGTVEDAEIVDDKSSTNEAPAF